MYKIETFYVPYGGPYEKIEWRKHCGALSVVDVDRWCSRNNVESWELDKTARTTPDSMGCFTFFRVTLDDSLDHYRKNVEAGEFKLLCENALAYLDNEKAGWTDQENALMKNLKDIFG